MPRRPRSRTIQIYLIKQELVEEANLVEDPASLTRHEIQSEGKPLGTLFIRPSHSNRPIWASLFDGYATLENIWNSSNAALLLLPAGGRMFAITFGYGRGLLQASCFEEGFGLRVTLGAMRPDSLRVIDKKTFDAIAQHTRQQATRGATTREFGLDATRDLVCEVTAIPGDGFTGSRLVGKDALSLSAPLSIPDLPILLEQYLTVYVNRDYQREFGWLDQIGEVTDRSQRQVLDDLLVDAIGTESWAKLWLAVPEIINWADVAGFRYGLGSSVGLHNDLHIQNYLQTVRNPAEIDIRTLKRNRVHAISATTDNPLSSWSVYRCVYFEVDHDGSTFLLNDGRWYRVTNDFVGQINNYYRAIDRSPLALPEYSDQDNSETAYNARVAAAMSQFALMDEKFIQHGGGYSKEEFCDLYSSHKDIVHIKRYGGSRVLSHLFSQGLVSAELFYLDKVFREKLNDLLPASHRLNDPIPRPDTAEYKIVFSIISNVDEDLELPFFSKLNLVNAARRISSFGYQVQLLRIRDSRDEQVS